MRSSVLFLLLFTCGGINAQKGTLNICRWHFGDKPEESDYQTIRKIKMYCFLSNDNDNIYIDIKVDDREVQEKILKEGLTIWISMNGKEERKMGVRFPMGTQNQGNHRKSDHAETNQNQDISRISLISQANTIEILGFINEQQRHFPSENRDNFRGAVKFDEKGILFYKMILPIAKLPVRNSRDNRGAMPFILGVEYGSQTVTNKSGVNRGPAPSSLFHSRSSGTSESYWIENVRLATSK
jgi:hypothetical protein